MRKVLALVLSLLMILSLFAGCAQKETNANKKETEDSSEKSGSVSTSGNGSESGSGGVFGSASKEEKTTTTVLTGLQTEDAFHSLTEAALAKTTYPSKDAHLDVAQPNNATAVTTHGVTFGGTLISTLMFYETLASWDFVENKPVPYLAQSWKWLDDLTLQIKLREDVYSALGDNLTASDIVYTFQWGAENKSLISYYSLFNYDEIKAVDKYTVNLALKKPYPYLTTDLCHQAYQIVVEASVDKIGGKEKTQWNPGAGTGPFELIEGNETIVSARRRDDYWGNAPYWATVTYHTVTDSNARVMGVEAGDFDMTYAPSKSDTAAAKDNAKLNPFTVASAGYAHGLTLNSDSELLANKALRQAIAYAINYEALVSIANSGLGVVGNSSIVNPLSMYYSEYDASAGYENCIQYNPKAAKEKMIEAGYADGVKLRINYSGANSEIIQTAEIIQNNLGEVGIELELSPGDAATDSQRRRNGDFDLAIRLCNNANPKKIMEQIDPRLGHNVVGGSCGSAWLPEKDFEKVLALIDKCSTSIDETELMQAWDDLQQYCYEYVPMIILDAPNVTSIASAEITNAVFNTTGTMLPFWSYPDEYLTGK